VNVLFALVVVLDAQGQVEMGVKHYFGPESPFLLTAIATRGDVESQT